MVMDGHLAGRWIEIIGEGDITFVCPVGLRIVKPGYVPPYVHMLVHGPSRICTHPSSMPIETFALVLTGGKTRGCEKPAGVSGAFEVAVAVRSTRHANADRSKGGTNHERE